MATVDQTATFATRHVHAVVRRVEDRIAGFDGVRAIAVLMVFVSHKTPLPHRDAYGSVGVWLFFVLSGMLISSILSEMRGKVEAGSQSSWRSMGDFYIRRSLRIFPLYYACLGVFAAGSLFTSFVGFSRMEATIYALYGNRNAGSPSELCLRETNQRSRRSHLCRCYQFCLIPLDHSVMIQRYQYYPWAFGLRRLDAVLAHCA